jgi:hypothetical protein
MSNTFALTEIGENANLQGESQGDRSPAIAGDLGRSRGSSSPSSYLTPARAPRLEVYTVGK